MKTIIVLGIKVNSVSQEELLNYIESYLSDNSPHYIATINPEIILAAQKDEEYFYILNQSDLNIADGIGLKFAGVLVGKNIIRHTGADLTEKLLALANNNYKIGIINWRQGLSNNQEIANALKNKYPNLEIAIDDIEKGDTNFNLPNIDRMHPEILLVALGAPWQEKFIYHFVKQAPFVKLAIGIGGTLDFYTDKLTRAPKIMRQLGLEWLWRLKEQPWRLKRIFNATVVFTIRFLKYAYINPFLYRPNISCLLYKREAVTYKMLLIRRSQAPQVWQFPQGGTDHEDLILAGSREIREEINTDKFDPVKAFKNLHKYRWPRNVISKFGVSSVKTRGYKGQKQSLLIAEYHGSDCDIRLNFWEYDDWQWADIDKVLDIVEPARRMATEKFLHKFNELVKK